ncbi:MAG TPA: nitroreductase family protein [bacterium]|nr:nitroreductase family protein [bacterium]
MELFEAIKGRRSVRKYKEGAEIEKGVLERIVDAGKYAASARAVYPWRFVVITDKSRIRELTGIVGSNGAFMKDAAAVIVVASEETKYYLEDGSAATQNMLLAAHSLGAGACWIAGDKKDYCGRVLEFVKAPEGYKLVSIISCGIPDETPVKEKPSLEKLMVWEKF